METYMLFKVLKSTFKNFETLVFKNSSQAHELVVNINLNSARPWFLEWKKAKKIDLEL